MPDPQNPLDWKLVLFALVACYLVPGIVLAGALMGVQRVFTSDMVTLGTAIISILGFFVPPVSGGYVAARFAGSRPWRHVVVVGVLGAVMSLLVFRTSPRAMVLYALASVALAVFGGYIRRQGRRDG